MDADNHVNDKLENAEDVRIVGARVGAIEELQHSTDAKQAIDAHEREVDAELQVEQVGRRCSWKGKRGGNKGRAGQKTSNVTQKKGNMLER